MTIERLGAGGDGIARLDDGRLVHVAGALAGERVLIVPARQRGGGLAVRLAGIVAPSPQRIPPPCRHFGHCGGCSVQALAPAAYGAWKSGLLDEALRRAGIAEVPVDALRTAEPGTRRRADFAVRSGAVGFHERRSGRVADVPGCLVLHPSLLALAERLRSLKLACLSAAEAKVNLLDNGLDLLLRGAVAPTLAETEALAAFAASADLARLCWATGGEEPSPMLVRRTPRIAFGGVAVEPPPGAFLQPTAAGEAAILSAVLDALADLPDRSLVVDLYAGLGTLSLPLARRFRVRSVEGDAAAAAALRSAVTRAGLVGRLAVETRDLAARPLRPEELSGVAAVVLDPPRAGAAAQAEALAQLPPRTAPARLVYVSCNLAAFARDARRLAAAGWRAVRAVPIDQFLWSAHLECVVTFSR